MSTIEGRIDIDLYPSHKKGERVRLSSSRPVHAARILLGKTPQQALDIIPLLFNICGTAQSHAALNAIESALESSPPGQAAHADELARRLLVNIETCKEHMLRLFLDWPSLFYLEHNNDQLPWLSSLVAHFRNALYRDGQAFTLDRQLQPQIDTLDRLLAELDDYLQQHVFGITPDDWLDSITDIGGLHDWALHGDTIAARSIATICDKGWASQGLSDCALLPPMSAQQLQQLFDDAAEDFIAAPRWQGRCHETSPLSRQFDQPLIQALHQEFDNTLITRWLARLVELASIPRQLQHIRRQLTDAPADALRQGEIAHHTCGGLSQVEAARGRLIHRVQIEDDLISRYQILAPTEWNFHPQGLVRQSLDSISVGDRNGLGTLAHIVINAIDPCVGYELRIH